MLNALRRVKYYRLYKKANFKLYVLDRAKKVGPIVDTDHALQNIFQWIEASFRATNDGGSSAYYTVGRGWKSSYPETTGYLIPTLYDYADYSQNSKWSDLANSAGSWLLSIQFENGAWQGGQVDSDIGERVFNSAMILDGIIECYERENDPKYLDSALKGLKWLVSCIGDDGVLSQHNISAGGSFDLLSLACMARAWQYLEGSEREDTLSEIRRSVSAHLELQNANGWWKRSNFDYSYPNTSLLHHLSYTLDGVLILSEILEDKSLEEVVLKSARKMLSMFEVNRKLPAFINEDWTPYFDLGDKQYSQCLTGYAQTSIVFIKLARLKSDKRFLNAAYKMIDILSSIGNRSFGQGGLDYGLAGSYPIFGNYQPFQIVNWAAKYHAESMLLLLNNSRSKKRAK